MHRKILVIGMILLLLCGSVTAFNTFSVKPQLKGQTLYVGGTGLGNYTKIQYAIDNASDGDIVFVYNDSAPYYENLVVDRSISLIGEDRNSTVVNGKNNDFVIGMGIDSSLISEFTLINADYGIMLYASNCSIINTKIMNTQFYGIHIEGNNNNLNNNIIADNLQKGIYIQNGNHNFITNNTIKFNGKIGLIIQSSNYNIITGNYFKENYNIWGDGICIQFEESCYNIFENNILTNDESSDFTIGFYMISNSNENNISFNEFLDAGFSGVIIQNCADNYIISNKINYHRDAGLILLYNIRTKVQNNEFLSNNNGIIFHYSFNNQILKNYFINNALSADFFTSFSNRWNGNYWDESRTFPYLILGALNPSNFFRIPWINFDWNPM